MEDRAVAVDRPVTLAEGADLLVRVTELAARRERVVWELVQVLAEANRAGVAEALEGLPIDVLLAVEQHWTAAERRMLLDAGEALAVMPATLTLWREGVISWSIVRDIVEQVRPLGRDGRALVDAQLAVSRALLAELDPGQVSWAVANAVEEVRGLTVKEQAEQSAQRESFLAVQLALDGRCKVYGELDAIDTAIVINGLDHHAERIDVEARGDGGRCRPTRGQRRAAALVGLCRDRLAGRAADGTVRPARPLFVCHVPLDRLTMTAAGLLEVAVPAGLPRLSATLVEALAEDADVRAVVMDGARPLCVTAKVHAAEVPDDVRLACAARDLGARDPGGTTPIPSSQLHHLQPGVHHVDRLVWLSRRGHLRIVHRHGWSGELDEAGRVIWTRQDRQIVTRPHGTRLDQPGEVPDPPPGRHQPG